MKLGIFSAWTIFIRQNNSDPVKSQVIVAYTITTITIVIFMAIVCYHIWVTIKTSQFVKNLTRKPHRQQISQRGARQNGRGNAAQAAKPPSVTYTGMNELRELLLI